MPILFELAEQLVKKSHSSSSRKKYDLALQGLS